MQAGTSVVISRDIKHTEHTGSTGRTGSTGSTQGREHALLFIIMD